MCIGEALDLFSVILAWLQSLVSPEAILWYALGLLTLPCFQYIRFRVSLWKTKRRLARKVRGAPERLVRAAMRMVLEAYPKAPLGTREAEIKNVLNVLARIVEIGGRNASTDWEGLWPEVDSSWLASFLSSCRMMPEPLLQEALARAFLYEAVTPGRFDQRHLNILVGLSSQDWKTLTAICSCSCQISGRITPVVFDYEESVYTKVGLDYQALDGLIAAGLVTHGGTGDTYTLSIPTGGMGIKYFDEKEFIVRPLAAPIERRYLGRKLVQPHPLDNSLNVGVVDFTEAGRTLGFLTACHKVDGFTEYLRSQWEEYLHD